MKSINVSKVAAAHMLRESMNEADVATDTLNLKEIEKHFDALKNAYYSLASKLNKAVSVVDDKALKPKLDRAVRTFDQGYLSMTHLYDELHGLFNGYVKQHENGDAVAELAKKDEIGTVDVNGEPRPNSDPSDDHVTGEDFEFDVIGPAGKTFYVSIRGHVYGYHAARGVDFNKLIDTFYKKAKTNVGAAFSWFKQNAILTCGGKDQAACKTS